MAMTKEHEVQVLTYIGGSDAPAIVLSDKVTKAKFKTPTDVWMLKTGRKSAKDISNLPVVKAGIMLEPVIADWFTDETGLKVTEHPKPIFHKDFPFIGGKVDRLGTLPDGTEFVLECKTAHFDKSKEWDNDAPTDYKIQLAHYLMITDRPVGFLAVLIDGYDFRVLQINRDAEVEKVILDAEIKFWNDYVLADTPPPAISLNDISQLYPEPKPESVLEIKDTTSEIYETVRQLSVISQLEKVLSTKKDDLKLQVAIYMKDYEKLITPLGSFNYKSESKKQFQEVQFKTQYPKLASEFTVMSEAKRVLRPYLKKSTLPIPNIDI